MFVLVVLGDLDDIYILQSIQILLLLIFNFWNNQTIENLVEWTDINIEFESKRNANHFIYD